MIGQIRLKELLEEYKKSKLPSFIIIVGNRGSGRKEFAKYLSKEFKRILVNIDNTVDGVRQLIELANTQTGDITYLIPEYEDMHQNAKHSLLKITEETPNNALIILTATSKESILQTLISRSLVLELDNYSEQELKEYAKSVNIEERYLDICSTINDINILKEMKDVDEFYNFVDNFLKNIKVANLGNAMKVSTKFKIKQDGEGYDINLFLNALMNVLSKDINKNTSNDIKLKRKLFDLIYETKRKLNNSYNKLSILDLFIIDFKEIVTDGVV